MPLKKSSPTDTEYARLVAMVREVKSKCSDAQLMELAEMLHAERRHRRDAEESQRSYRFY